MFFIWLSQVADKEEITIEKFNQAVEETKKKFRQLSLEVLVIKTFDPH